MESAARGRDQRGSGANRRRLRRRGSAARRRDRGGSAGCRRGDHRGRLGAAGPGPQPAVRRCRSPAGPWCLRRHRAVGAGGVIGPRVRDPDPPREGPPASRYAPGGGRSIGRLSGGADQPLVVVMVEAATALDDLDAILSVPGLDGVYVGPGDLSLSLNLDGADRWRDLRGVLSSIIARARTAGVPVGVHAYNGEDAAGYAAEGATVVTVCVDAVSLGEVMAHHLDVARGRFGTDRA